MSATDTENRRIDINMSQKRKLSELQPIDIESTEHNTTILFHSEKIEDRQSVFRAYFSPTMTPTQVQSLPEIRTAHHKMVAWRRESNQQSLTAVEKLYVTGSDDDGEKHGGRNIEQVLKTMHAVGTCVVARWYGGVMLGPVRFVHIKACASEAIKLHQDTLAFELGKRRRIAEEAQEKKKLVANLSSRDKSIVTLRKLAEDKERAMRKPASNDAANKQHNAGSNTETVAETVAADYEAMDLKRLRGLDKARDATLSFLLKRIDKAEKALASVPVTRPRSTEPG